MRYVVFICAVIGALFVVAGLMFSKGAPQEAAAAAMGLAFAVIPYVIFKTFAVTRANAQRDRIIELLEQQAKT